MHGIHLHVCWNILHVDCMDGSLLPGRTVSCASGNTDVPHGHGPMTWLYLQHGNSVLATWGILFWHHFSPAFEDFYIIDCFWFWKACRPTLLGSCGNLCHVSWETTRQCMLVAQGSGGSGLWAQLSLQDEMCAYCYSQWECLPSVASKDKSLLVWIPIDQHWSGVFRVLHLKDTGGIINM